MTFLYMPTRFIFRPVLFLVWIALSIFFSSPTVQADNAHREDINCDLHDGACVQRIDATDITLEVTPRPVRAMTDLVFKVTISGNGKELSAPPHIDLNMPKMNMGKNLVKMTTTGPSVYQGKGVIVRCASGHRVWRATVTVPDLGQADFIFDVIY